MKKTFKQNNLLVNNLLTFFNSYFEDKDNKDFELWACLVWDYPFLLKELWFTNWLDFEKLQHTQTLFWLLQSRNIQNNIQIELKEIKTKDNWNGGTKTINRLNYKIV